MRMVKHHMINILDTTSVNSVLDFRSRALPIVEELLSNNRIPFICGGTNYYIESLLWKVLIDEERSRVAVHSSSLKRKADDTDGRAADVSSIELSRVENTEERRLRAKQCDASPTEDDSRHQAISDLVYKKWEL